MFLLLLITINYTNIYIMLTMSVIIQTNAVKLLCMQSVPFKVVSSNPVHGEVYSIQHYVIKFVNDLWQVGGFHWVLRFPPPIKLATTM